MQELRAAVSEYEKRIQEVIQPREAGGRLNKIDRQRWRRRRWRRHDGLCEESMKRGNGK